MKSIKTTILKLCAWEMAIMMCLIANGWYPGHKNIPDLSIIDLYLMNLEFLGLQNPPLKNAENNEQKTGEN